MILIHENSYSSKEETTARVSFFIREKPNQKIIYQYSHRIQLKKGSRLYGFFSTQTPDIKIRITEHVSKEGLVIPKELEY